MEDKKCASNTAVKTPSVVSSVPTEFFSDSSLTEFTDEDGESSKVKSCTDQMKKKLSIGDKKDMKPVLEDVSIKGIVDYIKSGKAKNIITLVGAGISTAAGIPDFRSPKTGLYDNLAQYDLPHPQVIFMINFFMENPKPFFALCKDAYPKVLKPTTAHYFIRLLHEKGLLLRHYTQNIDTLERISGLPEDKLVEAHGTFQTSHCMKCRDQYSLEWLRGEIFSDKVPTCVKPGCGGVVKPDVVFFGEGLPERFQFCAMNDLDQCDLLIIMGTSLQVQPFASLPQRVPLKTPRLFINVEEKIGEDDGFFNSKKGGGKDLSRDVFWKATCDQGCANLADLLGWGADLKALVKKELSALDKKKDNKGDPKKSASTANSSNK